VAAHHLDPGGTHVSRRTLIQGLAAGAALASVPVAGPLLDRGPTKPTARATRAATRPIAITAPEIVTRAAWGADEGRRGAAQYDGAVEKFVIHHTGTHNGVADWSAQVRQIYEYETSNGYSDIAYHFLVDPNGRVYEGRWSRPGGFDGEDAHGRPVRGGHARGHNPRTIGIALLGNHVEVPPTEAALDALVGLLAWKCARWNVDPRGSGPYAGSGGVSHLPNIVAHGQVRATECPGPLLNHLLPELRERTAARLGNQPSAALGGYWIVSATGQEVAFGDVPQLNDGSLGRNVRLAGVTTHPSGEGYWAYGFDGGVFALGSAPFHGSLGGRRLNAPVVGLAPTPKGRGYWLAAADGGVFAFGDAHFHGSLAGRRLMAPIRGIESTRSGKGYWLYGADGGVFCFGDAVFHGSLSDRRLNSPIVDMAPSKNGYWLAARDGGVFCFGDAPFAGAGAPGPVVSIVPSRSRQGYLLLTTDGQVVPFGDAPYHGGATGRLPDSIGLSLPRRDV
jgi:hypothetical protein